MPLDCVVFSVNYTPTCSVCTKRMTIDCCLTFIDPVAELQVAKSRITELEESLGGSNNEVGISREINTCSRVHALLSAGVSG